MFNNNVSHFYPISLSPNTWISIISLRTRADRMKEAWRSLMSRGLFFFSFSFHIFQKKQLEEWQSSTSSTLAGCSRLDFTGAGWGWGQWGISLPRWIPACWLSHGTPRGQTAVSDGVACRCGAHHAWLGERTSLCPWSSQHHRLWLERCSWDYNRVRKKTGMVL